MIFYAEPSDLKLVLFCCVGVFDLSKRRQEPKSVADKESESAFWASVEELEAMSKIPPPKGLRGDELLVWARYIQRGGPVYPMGVLMMSEAVTKKNILLCLF